MPVLPQDLLNVIESYIGVIYLHVVDGRFRRLPLHKII